jgi:hypothetical protein
VGGHAKRVNDMTTMLVVGAVHDSVARGCDVQQAATPPMCWHTVTHITHE